MKANEVYAILRYMDLCMALPKSGASHSVDLIAHWRHNYPAKLRMEDTSRHDREGRCYREVIVHGELTYDDPAQGCYFVLPQNENHTDFLERMNNSDQEQEVWRY